MGKVDRKPGTIAMHDHVPPLLVATGNTTSSMIRSVISTLYIINSTAQDTTRGIIADITSHRNDLLLRHLINPRRNLLCMYALYVVILLLERHHHCFPLLYVRFRARRGRGGAWAGKGVQTQLLSVWRIVVGI